ncbi:hypothetical protein EYF80_028822 [Liparis tanakae]|uniref:Uncharacterized protein n=1 Tax=Liparis tanakae TaxID=230148 RepID=A0A4Z2H857_9TELE|nr:hypothetical protein EYF80_028822 [Liparis tanakae]
MSASLSVTFRAARLREEVTTHLVCAELEHRDTEHSGRSQTYGFQPEAVQVQSPLLLVEREQPAPAALVPLVLPHGFDAILQRRHKWSMHFYRATAPKETVNGTSVICNVNVSVRVGSSPHAHERPSRSGRGTGDTLKTNKKQRKRP